MFQDNAILFSLFFHLLRTQPSTMTNTNVNHQDATEDCDKIWWETASTPQNGESRYLIYFVAGNPCVISFYKLFLYELFKLLSAKDGPCNNLALGASSLPGYEIHPTGKKYSPSGLKQQTENVERLITWSIRRCSDSGDESKVGGHLKVVLVAHSMGAYMILEALRRRAEALNDLGDVHITGAVLLFPAITEIARSWRGSILKPFCSIPYFPALVSGFARCIFYPFSTQRLSWLLSTLGRMPTDTTDVAAQFLKSPHGIYSALHLTIDEMAMIKEDSWNHDIWGIAPDEHDDKTKTPQQHKLHNAVPLCFYYGAQDVWVWNESRDRLIASRGRQQEQEQDEATDLPWKPLMIIDDKDIPHGFTVNHSQIIAEKTFDLIKQLIREN